MLQTINGSSGAVLRLVTHNLCRGGIVGTGNAWQRILTDAGASIVCAQETLHPRCYLGDDCDRLSGVIYQAVPDGKWGSAIASRRHELTELPVENAFKGWVVGARVHRVEIDGGEQDLDVYSVHIPSPGPYERRVRQLIDILGRNLANCPRILAGDFNITTALRHESEQMANTPGERRILDRLRNELGLVNAWQAVNPHCVLPQTLRWTGNKAKPYHCDGIFVDHRLLPLLRGAAVLDEEPWTTLSDHNPVLAAFGN